MNRSVTVAIPEAAAEQLAELARKEFRAPRQQAAALLVEAIERAAARRLRSKAPQAAEPAG